MSELRRSAELPATRGRPAITQGSYGSRGNLELVLPDAVDGLWVCWFNSDDPAGEPADVGAVPGAWSGGLHFASGRTYTEAAICQARRGPDFLVLVAVADNELEYWIWTPEKGFARRSLLPRPPDRQPAIGAVSIGETPDGFVVAAADASGIVRWSAMAADFPDLDWRCDRAYATADRATALATRIEPTGRVTAAAVTDAGRVLLTDTGQWHAFGWLSAEVASQGLELAGTPDGDAVLAATADGTYAVHANGTTRLDARTGTAIRAARSVTDAERVEIVQRSGPGLVHLRTVCLPQDPVLVESARPVVSEVWWPADSPVHRR